MFIWHPNPLRQSEGDGRSLLGRSENALPLLRNTGRPKKAMVLCTGGQAFAVEATSPGKSGRRSQEEGSTLKPRFLIIVLSVVSLTLSATTIYLWQENRALSLGNGNALAAITGDVRGYLQESESVINHILDNNMRDAQPESAYQVLYRDIPAASRMLRPMADLKGEYREAWRELSAILSDAVHKLQISSETSTPFGYQQALLEKVKGLVVAIIHALPDTVSMGSNPKVSFDAAAITKAVEVAKQFKANASYDDR